MMLELSKKKPFEKTMIFIATYLSFCLAYIVYDFGVIDAKGFGNKMLTFLMIGVFFYLIFEVVASCFYNLYYRFVPNFCLGREDFRMYMRVLFIFRNIAITLINIIFIFFPVASIWGIKLTHIVTTILAAFVGIKLLGNKIDNAKYRYLFVTGILTFCYLIIYLFFGVIA